LKEEYLFCASLPGSRIIIIIILLLLLLTIIINKSTTTKQQTSVIFVDIQKTNGA
jgi:hypothetical protein